MSFGRWAREQLDKGLAPGSIGTYSTMKPPPPELPPKNLESLARELVERAKVTGKKCDRRLPQGAFCKSCGKIHV